MTSYRNAALFADTDQLADGFLSRAAVFCQSSRAILIQ